MTAFIPPQLIELIRANGARMDAEHSSLLERAGMDRRLRELVTDDEHAGANLAAAFEEADRCWQVELAVLTAASRAGRALSEDEIRAINASIN